MSFIPKGIKLNLSDGATVFTEVVADEDDAHTILYVLLEDMIQRRNMLVGFATEWNLCRSGTAGLDHPIVMLKFYTELGCILVRLKPGAGSVSPSLRQFMAFKDAIFAGVHIKEDLEKLRREYGIVVGNAVELSELAAAVMRKPALAAYGARELAGKVGNRKKKELDPKPMTVIWSNWCEGALSMEQIESATVDAYAAYRVGETMLSCGS
ncbi:unnamed protein product [Linum trigynum]|uniref:3'-5' exonuclease domain-containing protein n=1 Tax=Linum trigynum TaxID=586398 RepID=A0AAV2EA49_9ROSI